MSQIESVIPVDREMLDVYKVACRQSREQYFGLLGQSRSRLTAAVTQATAARNQAFQAAWTIFRATAKSIDEEFNSINSPAKETLDAAVAVAKSDCQSAILQAVAVHAKAIAVATLARQAVYKQAREGGSVEVYTPAADIRQVELRQADEAFSNIRASAADLCNATIVAAQQRRDSIVERARNTYAIAVSPERVAIRDERLQLAMQIRDDAIALADQAREASRVASLAEHEAIISAAKKVYEEDQELRLGIWCMYEAAVAQAFGALNQLVRSVPEV